MAISDQRSPAYFGAALSGQDQQPHDAAKVAVRYRYHLTGVKQTLRVASQQKKNGPPSLVSGSKMRLAR
jgi:hypothetical protein